MAAFLHVAPTGMRFNGPELGAWYAAAGLTTAAAEVGHHLRRETVQRNVAEASRTYRAYTARLGGDYLDISGEQATRPQLYASASYAAAQQFGESLRAAGGDGILYDSLRLSGGVNVVAYRPSKIEDVAQADHFEISVRRDERRIDVRRLSH